MRLAIAAGILASGGMAFSALGQAVLKVDIGGTTQEVAAGYTGINLVSQITEDSVTNANRLDNAQPVTITLAADQYIDLVEPGGRTQDAGEETLPLDQVIQDFFKVDQDALTVRLGGLSAGNYSVLSYHNAPNTGFNFSQDFRVEVKDAANPSFTTVLNQLATTTASDPALAETAAFNVVSNGTAPVEFRFISNVVWGNEQPPERAGHPNNVLLNGFDVNLAALEGDFNADAKVDATDIDLLCNRINAATGDVEPFDVNNDGSVNQADVNFQVTSILHTKFGDTDTDGDVDLNDLGNLASGFGIAGEKRWSRGNFDCDLDVDLNDLGTLATNFQAGRAAAFAAFEAAVPEPSAVFLLGSGALGMWVRRRRGS
jgi:hypothetical protein